jgi:hypothetical protein
MTAERKAWRIGNASGRVKKAESAGFPTATGDAHTIAMPDHP